MCVCVYVCMCVCDCVTNWLKRPDMLCTSNLTQRYKKIFQENWCFCFFKIFIAARVMPIFIVFALIFKGSYLCEIFFQNIYLCKKKRVRSSEARSPTELRNPNIFFIRVRSSEARSPTEHPIKTKFLKCRTADRTPVRFLPFKMNIFFYRFLFFLMVRSSEARSPTEHQIKTKF